MPEQSKEIKRQALPPMAMHDAYGPLMRSFFARYFSPIPFPKEAMDTIRDLAQKGIVVYIAPSANLIHFLYMNYLCIRHQLPLADFVNGVDPVLLQPVSTLWDRIHKLGEEDVEEAGEQRGQKAPRELKQTIEAGRSSLLFLDQPTTITNPRTDQQYDSDLLGTLIRLQQTTTKPIFLVPHLIKWNLHPERKDKGLSDTVFGQNLSPGLLLTLYFILRYHRQAVLKIAEPINLRKFLDEFANTGSTKAAAALEKKLEKSLSMEVFDLAGPRIKSHEEFLSQVLQDPMIQNFIEDEAAGDENKQEELNKKAYDMLDEIAAEPRIRWPLALNRTLELFWKKMYEGFVVSPEGFEKIRQAIRRGPVVFCPSHKSHVDYLVLSQLCLRYKVPLPHIAAGVNLSFWPMGPIFRHSGAFFLRRSFKGDKLYPVVFRTYLRHVMAEGFPIEFFIEGTRSRTGKLLGPRYGILSWLFQSFQEGTGQDLQFIPISIDYEKLVESKSYVRELSGADKKKEDVAALLKARKVLRSKYGKIYVQIGDPISVKKVLAERNLDGKSLGDDDRRVMVQHLAHGILFGINQVSTVTPSAIVAFCLLNNRRRGMINERLLSESRWLLRWLKNRGARLSYTLENFDRALAEAVSRFSRDGLLNIRDTGQELVYSVPEGSRLALDYYRNNLIHHFVTASLTMTAAESFTVDAVPLQTLSTRVQTLSKLFKNEFLFRSQKHFDQEMDSALDDLKREGTIKIEDGFVIKLPEAKELRQTFKAVLEHFLESYWLTAKALKLLQDTTMSQKEFFSKTLQFGDRLFVKGEILWPEAVSREIVRNALKTYEQRGLVEQYSHKGKRGSFVKLTDKATPEAIEELATEVAVFLNRT